MFHGLFPLLALADFPGAAFLIPLATIVGVFLVLKFLTNCYALFVLRQLDHTESAVTEEELHPEVRRQLQPWLDRLGALGFSKSGIAQIQQLSNWERYLWRLTHAETGSIAELRIMIPPTGAAPRITLNLYSFLSDRRLLVTTRPGGADQAPTHWFCVTKNFQTVGKQCGTHLARLRTLAPAVTSIRQSDVGVAMVTELVAVDQAACAAGILERDPAKADLLRIRRLAIPLMALKMFRYSLPGQGMVTRLEDLAAPSESVSVSQNPVVFKGVSHDLVEQDIKRYQQLASKKSGMGKLAKLALLLVTIGLFALFLQGQDLGKTAGIVIGVLLLHEFGHWLPMKLFGYQNVTMFFIPGLGAAVSGEKHAVPAWQEFIVLLGGPLPGLVAGISVMILGYFHPEIPDLLLDAAVISVLLNAFNLLPFLPLDGGRILDLLIFKDLPLLRLFFNGFSALIAVGLCFIPGNRGFTFLAIIMVLGCYRQMKMLPVIRIAKKLGWAGTINTEEGALRQFFTDLRDSGNTNYVGSTDWLAKTRTIIEEALRKPPGWFARISGLSIYAVTCVTPLLLFGLLGWYVVERVEAPPETNTCLRDLQQQLPKNHVMLGAADLAPISKLAEDTDTLSEDTGENDIHALAAALPVEALRGLDQLRWDHIGISARDGIVSSSTVAIWLEAACQSMENASKGVTNAEAVRRLEILLYAIHSLEPASNYSQREQLWDVQVRTLQTIGKLNGTGAIPPELQAQLKQRLQLLRQVPNPTREAFLLVEGWSQHETALQFQQAMGTATTDAEAGDESLCRELYRLLKKPEKSLSRGVAIENVALRWVQQGKVDGLPDESPSEEPLKPAEANFLRHDRNRRQEITWLQETVLYVMSLDATHRKNGQLPQQWNHSLTGGGKLELYSRAPRFVETVKSHTGNSVGLRM